jgi:DNA polymerase III delta prime subunit
MNYNFNNLWVEKYRPKTLDDFIICESNKNIINSFKSKKEIPNLLFTGSPGLGKTTLAKIIVNNILKCQYLYINASDENGIDTIRNKVVSFAQTKSFDGSIKVIILDETDGLSIDAQRALRNTMEEFAMITRFILTANFRYRIIAALQSRCQSIDLTPSSELLGLVVKKCALILKKEGIEISDNIKAPFIQFVKSQFPDLRKTINEIQKFSSTGTLILLDQTNTEVLNLIYSEIKNKNIQNLRKALIENEGSFNSDYVNLLKGLFNYIDKTETDLKAKKNMLIIIAEHLYRSSFVVDQEINCYSCLINLSQLKEDI